MKKLLFLIYALAVLWETTFKVRLWVSSLSRYAPRRLFCRGYALSLLFVLIFSVANGEEYTLSNSVIVYGSQPRTTDGEYSITSTIGQVGVGTTQDIYNSVAYGIWSLYLMEPRIPFTYASDGDYPERIELTWAFDPLSPPADEGYKVFRDGSLLGILPGNQDAFQDFNVLSGQVYEYGLLGINEFGEGSHGYDVGFMNPNGVITGHVQTTNEVPVADVEVNLTPNLGRALTFDGVDDYVSMGDDINIANSSFTIEFWAKRDALNEYNFAIGQGNWGTNNEALHIGFNGSNGMLFGFYGDDLGTTDAYTDNDWHHWAFTYNCDTNQRIIYRDGTEAASGTATADYSGTGEFFVGKISADSYFFDGNLDDIRIWNVERSKADIKKNMNRTLSSADAGDSLFAYWKFDEGISTKVFDLTDNSRDGFIYGPQWTTDKCPALTSAFTNEDGNYIIDGIYYGTGTTFTVSPQKIVPSGRSLDFDGYATDYVEVPYADTLNPASEFTFEAWVKVEGSTGNYQSVLTSRGINKGYMLYVTPGNEWEFNVGTGGTWTSINCGAVTTDEWLHVAATYGDSLKFYINGQQINAVLSEGFMENSEFPLRIGAGASEGAPQFFFNGKIDEVRIWDVVRTQPQIDAAKDIGLDGDETELVGYWKFNEGREDIVADKTENGNHGTIVNYNANIWSTDIPLDENIIHEFNPQSRYVTLNPSNTATDAIDFTDMTLVAVSGFVKFEGTDCYMDSVEILVDGQSHYPPVFTDEDGEFIVELEPGSDHQLSASYGNHQFSLPNYAVYYDVVNITEPIAGVLFLDRTKRDLKVTVAGGSCMYDLTYSGNIYVNVETTPSCFETDLTLDQNSGNISVTFSDLPPAIFEVTIDADDPDMKSYFEEQGGFQVDLEDSSSTEPGLEFIYRAPLEVEIDTTWLFYSECDNYQGPEGEPLDAAPIFTERVPDDIYMEIFESYGANTCLLDTGFVTIYDNIGDDIRTRYFSDGEVVDTIIPGQANLLAGGDHPYQKGYVVVVQDNQDRTASDEIWGYVLGYKKRVNQFTTYNPLQPIMILRDPHGDGSYSYMKHDSTYTVIKRSLEESTTYFGKKIKMDWGTETDIVIPLGGPTIKTKVKVFRDGKSLYGIKHELESFGEYSVTFSETFSTSDNPLVTGEEGDVFIGIGENIVYGLADELSIQEDTLGVCTVVLDTIVTIRPDSIVTTYMYTERHIKDYVIPELLFLAADTTVTPEDSATYALSVELWQDWMAMNDSLKGVAQFKQNISFDAGTIYEFSTIKDNIEGSYEKWGLVGNSESENEIGLWLNGTGGSVIIMSKSSSYKSMDGMTETAGLALILNALARVPIPGSEFIPGLFIDPDFTDIGNRTNVTTEFGYVLTDDDVGDFYSIDVKEDGSYGSPVFDLVSGRSSCPWEIDTQPRDGVNLLIDGLEETENAPAIPPTEPVTFTLNLGNTSQSGETREYHLRQIIASNPDGAIIKVNGVPLSSDPPLSFFVPAGESYDAILTVEKGPEEYDYENLQIMAVTPCEYAHWPIGGWFEGVPDSFNVAFADTVTFTAHFQQPCAEVSIYDPPNNWLINSDTAEQDTLQISITDYDKNQAEFQSVKLQYRPVFSPPQGRSECGDSKVLQVSKIMDIANEKLSKFSMGSPSKNINESKVQSEKLNVSKKLDQASEERFTSWINIIEIAKANLGDDYHIYKWNTANLDDGHYEIRAVTVCNADAPSGASGIITGVIARTVPEVLGEPEPNDGVLKADDEISITFTKNINCAQLLEANQGDHENVGLYNTENNSLIDIEFSCYDNTIEIVPNIQNKFIENKVLRAEIWDVEDNYGNVMPDSVIWEFLVDRNPMRWDNGLIFASKYQDEELAITREIVNNGGTPMAFKLTNLPPWLSASPDTAIVEIGSPQPITFTFDAEIHPGTYLDTLYACTSMGDEPLKINFKNLCYEPAWDFDPFQYQFSMNMIAELYLDSALSDDTNDMIAVLVDGQIRGVASVEYISSLDSYLTFITIYSNVTSGEELQFRIWDSSICTEVGQIQESYSFTANTVLGTLSSPVPITATPQIAQEIDFPQGWKWFSLNLASPDMAANTLLNSLSPATGDIVKSQTQFSQYVPNVGWIGSLITLDNQSMYMMKLAGADTLEMVGYKVEPAANAIPVVSGWNWVGYSPQMSIDVNSALSSLNNNLVTGDLIKSQLNFAQYLEGAGWIGSLDHMSPNLGYLLEIGNPGILIYPETPQERFVEPTDEPPQIVLPEGWQCNPAEYQYNMTITGIVLENENDITDSLEAVAAFVGEDCRGIAYPVYIPQTEQTYIFIMVYSNAELDEEVTFLAYDEGDDNVYSLMENIIFQSDEMIGDAVNPFVWTTQPNTNILEGFTPAIPNKFFLGQNYPNPFNPTTTIAYGLPKDTKVEVGIYNVLGERICTLIRESQEAGYKSIMWNGLDDNGKEVASGVYIYKISTGEFEDNRKLIMLK